MSLILFFIIVVLFSLFCFIVTPLTLWFQCLVSENSLGFLNIFFMKFKKIPAKLIVDAMITSEKAGVPISSDKLEAHFLAGGNVMSVVQSVVTAHKAAIDLSFEKAASLDLAGKDVYEAVRTSVNPKVIKTPTLAAVPKDEVELSLKAQVTIRADIDRLSGNAGEDTILARVGEGIITYINSAETHHTIVEKPDIVSKRMLEKGFDTGTAFDILSINITSISKNVV